MNSPPVSFVTLGESLNRSEPHFLASERGEQINTHKGLHAILEQVEASINGSGCFHFLLQDINPAFPFPFCPTTGAVGVCLLGCMHSPPRNRDGLTPRPRPVAEVWLTKGHRHSWMGTRLKVGEQEAVLGLARRIREPVLLELNEQDE